MNLCPLLENNRDSVKRKNACAGVREPGALNAKRIFSCWVHLILSPFQEIVHIVDGKRNCDKSHFFKSTF